MPRLRLVWMAAPRLVDKMGRHSIRWTAKGADVRGIGVTHESAHLSGVLSEERRKLLAGARRPVKKLSSS